MSLQYQEQASRATLLPDTYSFMDKYINTARHMISFGCTVEDIRAQLKEDGGTRRV